MPLSGRDIEFGVLAADSVIAEAYATVCAPADIESLGELRGFSFPIDQPAYGEWSRGGTGMLRTMPGADDGGIRVRVATRYQWIQQVVCVVSHR